jgi:hypothetical protein
MASDSKFDSDTMDNKVDVSDTMFFDERNVHMARDARAATHDGSPGGANGFESQGSDANHGKPAGSSTELPSWIS